MCLWLSFFVKCGCDFPYEFPDRKLSDLIGNQSLDSDVCLRHEFPDLIFFKAIWEVRYCKCFKIQVAHSLWFLKRYKNCFSGNCFSRHCKYLVKQFPACCFILKNGNSWRNAQLISSKKSKSRSFFSLSGNSWIPGYPGQQKTHWNVEISMGQSLTLVGMTGFEPAAFASFRP